MKQKAARICLIVAIVLFVLGAFILGHAPEWFIITAAFAVGAVVFGVRWIRITGALLVVISIVVAISEYQARQQLRERVREIQQKAGGHI